ncbi:26S protease regulatory subunit 6b (nucleomorph) [Cryptomonas paramecium]|uniref:26S protease regulatory subunit 6b n=1 Tax=Cryptomonas paramaecium TaxID=2898 RepID=F2HHQ6_9CRYP|nr:26S protease regulatory subunit 6b [Cryptomonas paramecium]AEA38852.1 26S protease regulatory subunit 6b [Cryptomonas paramecium]|mmetsp:Transcript_5594/g.17882  ORF Transcript_5594/g.17882 Transcript_5594/m.17882 type:complete len:380 (+) Transcript_5594:2512-3651(+)
MILKQFVHDNLKAKYFYTLKKMLKYNITNLEMNLILIEIEIFFFQSVPLIIGQFLEKISHKNGIVNSSTGNNHFVRIMSTVNENDLKINTNVALHKNSNALVGIIKQEKCLKLGLLLQEKKPDVKYSDIGGMDSQKEELREVIEFPLLNKKIYHKIGINAPKGVLLYGPPGTGKTLLVKAVASKTTASFLKTVGSEFVQKYLGEGPKMVRELFKIAKENSPSIIFIDEIDAIATRRFDAQTGADREVQRILIELLVQMDGFDQTFEVKIILSTNRVDILDPAIMRPGRIDRKIEFPLPDLREKKFLFQVLTSKMNLSEEIDLNYFSNKPEKLSGAIICSICQEAGLQAIRKNRYMVIHKDFEIAYRLNIRKENIFEFYN